MADERYSRQIQAFGEDGQRKIHSTTAGIVGLGGLGSQMAQGLAYLGLGSFVLVDDDHVDETNLNRLVGAYPDDAQAHALKVNVAKRHIERINPDAHVIALPISVRDGAALDELTACPVIFGGLDNDGARLVLSELTAAYANVLIDAASDIIVAESGEIDFGGRVVVARSGRFCLDCANEIDMEIAKQELEPDSTKAIRRVHGYGLGSGMPSPSVVSLNGIVANLAVTEFLALVTGVREVQQYLVYRGMKGTVVARANEKRPGCYICEALAGIGDRANIHRYTV